MVSTDDSLVASDVDVEGTGSTMGLIGEAMVADWPRIAAIVLLGGPMMSFLAVFLMLGPFLCIETGIGILEDLGWSGVLKHFFTISGVAVGSF